MASEQRVLEQSRDAFIDEEPIYMLADSAILENVKSTTPIPSGTRQNVSVARVNTYIYRTEVSKTSGNLRIVFPTFASHWAVIVCEANFPGKHGMAYHLTFRERESAQLSPPAGTSREVVFATMPMEDTPNGMKEVGTTRFSHAERMNIGQAMIKAFGLYHRVFWNCQHSRTNYVQHG